MDLEVFVQQVRDHYVDQFLSMVAGLRKSGEKGAAELSLRLNGEPGPLYGNHYRFDYLMGDPPQPCDFAMDRTLTFKPFTVGYGRASLSFELFEWDNVCVVHSLATALNGLDQWFADWFAPEDEHRDERADLMNKVHSLGLYPGELSVDFGTAPPEAFWRLLELLERHGARTLRITSQRSDSLDD